MMKSKARLKRRIVQRGDGAASRFEGIAFVYLVNN